MNEAICITIGFALGAGFVCYRWWATSIRHPDIGKLEDRLAGLKASLVALLDTWEKTKRTSVWQVEERLRLESEVAELESWIARLTS